MTGKIADRIEASAEKATRTEKVLIKKLLLLDAHELVYMSITELAQKIDIAEATILRYCRKIGYKGFQDFKLSLSQELGDSLEVDVNDNAGFLENLVSKTLSKDAGLLPKDQAEEVAKKILAANKVCCFGVGNSSIAGVFFTARLLKLGIEVVSLSDPHYQAIIAANLTKKDFLILVSVSGGTKDIIDVAKIARTNGVPIMVITNYPASPIAKFADYLFVSYGKEVAYQGGTTAAIISQIFILGVIAEYVCARLGKVAVEKTVKGAKSVSDKAL